MGAQLGLGTANFLPGYGPTAGGSPNPALLAAGFAEGIRYVDTAAAYGGGEAALGQLADEVRSLGVRVATKIQPPVQTRDAYTVALHLSLQQLRLSAVDTVMLHSAPGALLASADVARAWSGLRSAAPATRFGASTYGVADARVAASAPWCDALQVEFSILNQSVIGALRRAGSPTCEVIVRSVLCKGLLTPAALGLTLAPAAVDTLRALSAIAARLQMDLATMAIRFALDTPGIDVVLVGVSTLGELQAVIRAWRLPPLSARAYDEIAAFDRSSADWTHPERWPGGRPDAAAGA